MHKNNGVQVVIGLGLLALTLMKSGSGGGNGGGGGRGGRGGGTSDADIRAEVERIVAANQARLGGRGARNQYPIGKAQERELQALGLLEFVPRAPFSKTIGNNDARAVLEAARQASGTAVFNSYGEGVSVGSQSTLNRLMSSRRGR